MWNVRGIHVKDLARSIFCKESIEIAHQSIGGGGILKGGRWTESDELRGMAESLPASPGAEDFDQPSSTTWQHRRPGNYWAGDTGGRERRRSSVTVPKWRPERRSSWFWRWCCWCCWCCCCSSAGERCCCGSWSEGSTVLGADGSSRYWRSECRSCGRSEGRPASTAVAPRIWRCAV